MYEYNLIKSYYGNRKTKRSQQPLIKHIDEGLTILNNISATDNAKRAFCLHPLVQNAEDLSKNFGLLHNLHPHVVILVMEYRNIANQYLSKRIIESIDEIELSSLYEVNDMLIADKVQNYSDFMKFHYGTHNRSTELRIYFNNWLNRLDAHKIYNNFAGNNE